MEPSKSKQPDPEVRNAIEAALMTAQKPLDARALARLFSRNDPGRPSRETIREVVGELAESYNARGIELVEVAGGWRIQARSCYAAALGRLWEEKPPRYSRALLETLAIIAYRQPVTRGDIESIRGISVNANIIRTLTERDWVRVVGHREVPGRPELFATTREFLDYFGFRRLQDLPPLPEPRQHPGDNEHATGIELTGNTTTGAEQAGDDEVEGESSVADVGPALVTPAEEAEEAPAVCDDNTGNGSARWPGYAASSGEDPVDE